MIRLSTCLTCLAATLLCFGCNGVRDQADSKGVDDSNRVDASDDAPPPAGSDPTAAATTEDLESLGGTLEQAMQDRDIDLMNRLVDNDRMLRDITSGFGISQRQRQGFIAGLKQASPNFAGGLGGALINSMPEGTQIRFLGIRRRNAAPLLLVRIVRPDGSLTYFEFKAERGARRDRGELRVVDIYTYSTGEWMSETLRRAAFPYIIQLNRDAMKELPPAARDLVESDEQLRRLALLAQQGDLAGFEQLHKSLPATVKSQKLVLMLRLAVSQNDDQASLRVIEDFQRLYPGDSALLLHSLTWHLLREEFEESLLAIDRLDERLGGDPYLDVMRANVHLQSGDSNGAKETAQAAIAADATLHDGYWILLSVALEDKDFGSAAKYLQVLESSRDVNFDEQLGDPIYGEFLRSESGQLWMRQRSGNNP